MAKEKCKKCCILLSGGIGTRLGVGIPKQYIEVHGRTIFEYTLRSVLAWEGMDSLIVVADPAFHRMLEFVIRQYIPENIDGENNDVSENKSITFLGFSEPGVNRQGSIINALHDISDNMAKNSVVMIHDAVRPLTSAELIADCDKKLGSADGVMPYIAMKDTIYESKKSGKNLIIKQNIDRDNLVAGQTPEFFKYEKYKKCCDELTARELSLIHGSTEPAVLGGMKIALVKGDEGNFKITTPEDLDKFREIVEKQVLYKQSDLDIRSKKKTILYCINTASLIFYEDEMIEKIKRNFETFADSADGVNLLWTVDQNSDEKLQIASSSVKRKFRNLLKKNLFSEAGRYIEYQDAVLMIDDIDAYYGDWNFFAWKCQQLGKLVMIQNIEV